ncbi:unnamed protein product [Cyprideis torosa]|uniref:Uncharacterized protein n=1 Tax=Cyprideis torosa TaxID=163714 RepID=A0A7R8ZGW1_9CRUS|nr:unnamed protein product [Cyprideis torosa]CAG0882315.1 unnamed protein product [Cyprideis torosa]
MGEFEVHNLAFIPDQESQTMKEKLTEIPLGPVDMVVKAEAGEVAKDGATAPVAGLSGLQYAIDDIPPSHISVFLGLQHFLMMVGGTMIIPLLLSDKLCITNEDPARAYLLSTILFVSGIVTFLQCTLGSRLPIIQGGTFSLILPAFAILDLPENKCPSNADLEAMTDDERAEVWMSRMRIIQGGIILASLVQVFVGFTGLIGYVMKWISPISICPLIALVGLSLFDVAATDASENWGIAAMTIVLLLLFSQYISEWDVPVFPKWNFTTKTFSVTKLKIFKLFPVILTLCTAWLVCYILTVTEALPENDKARTDIKSSILRKSPWIRVPYPFQWGMPRVTASAFIGMLAGVLASAMESIGDYFACARLAGKASGSGSNRREVSSLLHVME